jgi:hypothetical protein
MIPFPPFPPPLSPIDTFVDRGSQRIKGYACFPHRGGKLPAGVGR